ncbi:MAG: hypothetical protein EOM37_04995 [Proteobacteria bacterium]|nr:hypothetical protein [Pseudomonadota bacterium]
MHFTNQEKKEILNAIQNLDTLHRFNDMPHDKYADAVTKCGFITFIAGMFFIGVLFENPEIKEMIGSVGVGALPVVLLGTAIYFFNIRKKHERHFTNCRKAAEPLRKLNLSYSPETKSLYDFKMQKDLDIQDFN